MRKIIVSPGGIEVQLRQQMTTENLIWIKGGAHKDIKKALRQWIDLYANESLAFLGYCLLVKQNLGFYKPDLAGLGASYPLSLLITQKPARLIFKKLLNREPIVCKPPPTFLGRRVHDHPVFWICYFIFGCHRQIQMNGKPASCRVTLKTLSMLKF